MRKRWFGNRWRVSIRRFRAARLLVDLYSLVHSFGFSSGTGTRFCRGSGSKFRQRQMRQYLLPVPYYYNICCQSPTITIFINNALPSKRYWLRWQAKQEFHSMTQFKDPRASSCSRVSWSISSGTWSNTEGSNPGKASKYIAVLSSW